MRSFIRAKSIFLLLVFCSYLFLSCVQEKDARTHSIETTISNIQERLEAKDYKTSKHLVNPYQDVKKETKKALLHMQGKFGNKHPKFQQVNNHTNNNGIFRLASMAVPVSVDESTTFGIDDPANLVLAIDEFTAYFGGVYTRDQVETMLTSMNNDLINYPLNYSGADQFLNDKVNNSSITEAQRLIIQSELYAILDATSTTEVLNILNVVTEEVMSSQLTSNEQAAILYVNAEVEALAESDVIALMRGNPLQFGYTGKNPVSSDTDVKFKQVAGTVILIILIGAAIGAVTGLILGGWVCSGANTSGASWDCVEPWVIGGAIAGGLIAIP